MKEDMKDNKQFITEPARSIPVRTSVDVLVVGGGPSGIMAAEAAAKKGLKVMLIESKSFLGGNLTIGLPILGYLSQKGKLITQGLAQKFIDRLKAKNAASDHRPCPLHMSLTIVDSEEVKNTALEIMTENNVEVLFYAFFAGVVKEGNELKGIIIESKVGREAILAKVVIDCSGDADVAFKAGVPCGKGDENGGMQPPTLMFCMKGVDVKKLRMSIANEPEIYDMDTIPNEFFRKDDNFITVGLRGKVLEALKDGLQIPTERTILISGLGEDEIWVNMSRINGVDGTDPASLTHGEIEGRKQIIQIQKYLKQYVPGFEEAYLDRVAPFLGIRETRRIVGQYVLTEDDLLSRRNFEDAIAVASYPIDIHHPDGGGCTLRWSGDCYDIPYRSLVPLEVENLLVAGRSISTTHEAMSAIRVMAPCMLMGEAAGLAASLAIKHGIYPSQVDAQELRKEILSEGGYLR